MEKALSSRPLAYITNLERCATFLHGNLMEYIHTNERQYRLTEARAGAKNLQPMGSTNNDIERRLEKTASVWWREEKACYVHDLRVICSALYL